MDKVARIHYSEPCPPRQLLPARTFEEERRENKENYHPADLVEQVQDEKNTDEAEIIIEETTGELKLHFETISSFIILKIWSADTSVPTDNVAEITVNKIVPSHNVNEGVILVSYPDSC